MDRTVSGRVHIAVPGDWKVMPEAFDYTIKPGEYLSKKIVLSFLGEGRDGIIKVSTVHDGMTLQDVLEVGEHNLDVTATRDGDIYRVNVKNPNNQSIEGELYIVTPQETWGERYTPDFALASVTPRMQGFSIPVRDERGFEFRISRYDTSAALSSWAVVKCAYNGKVEYLRIE